MSALAQDSTAGSITALLLELSQGNRDVEGRLAPLVSAKLRQVASRHMRRERANHTLQATAPVNEAWLRLMEQPNHSWESRTHFFGGLAFDEIALVLGVSTRTIKRDWSVARAWLHDELSKAS